MLYLLELMGAHTADHFWVGSSRFLNCCQVSGFCFIYLWVFEKYCSLILVCCTVTNKWIQEFVFVLQEMHFDCFDVLLSMDIQAILFYTLFKKFQMVILRYPKWFGVLARWGPEFWTLFTSVDWKCLILLHLTFVMEIDHAKKQIPFPPSPLAT